MERCLLKTLQGSEIQKSRKSQILLYLVEHRLSLPLMKSKQWNLRSAVYQGR